jgi:hypothetical protein
MKRPETYKELMKYVNPKDLYEIFGFSGINDHTSKTNYDLRVKYLHRIYESMRLLLSHDLEEWRNPLNIDIGNPDEFYATLIRCIQDYYWWSHQFNHIYATIYQRIMNALDIDITEYNIGKHFEWMKQ